MSHILIVDDEPAICWALKQALSEDGHQVTTTATAEDALQSVHSKPPDVIMMDVRLPGMNGITAIEQLRERQSTTPVIVMTAFGNLETAVGAVNSGAFEYLSKPFDLDDAIGLVRSALASSAEGDSVRQQSSSFHTGGEVLLGDSPAMQTVFRRIALVAKHHVPVLISGESGTGKELVAQMIHQYSARSQRPFVPVCVPAMNEALVESELFGHVRGAFTGADYERQGLLTAADGGTAFFDEIGDISVATQLKLLRVLETRTLTPVGSNEVTQSDFRLVAATNRNLEKLVQQNSFREDLLFRLNVFRIEMPALRERRGDIPRLAHFFLSQFSSAEQLRLSDEVLQELQRRPWWGNVRELKNAIEHAIIVTRSRLIGVDALPPPAAGSASPDYDQQSIHNAARTWLSRHASEAGDEAGDSSLMERFLSEVEPIFLQEALAASAGNRSAAARLLGMHRQTLREKLRRYDLDAPGSGGNG